MREEKGYKRRFNRCLKLGAWACVLAALLLYMGSLQGALDAQTVTGQITGTVTDPSGAIIAGAKVTLTNTLTQQVRSLTSNASGDFQFTDVVPGTYELQITQSGFSTYNQNNIVLGTREALALHQIQLQVGAVTNEVTVSAVAARVETDTSGHSGLVTDSQITSIPDKGRNFKDYLQLLPGTVSGGQTDAPGWGSGAVQFNGGDAGTVLVQLDGIASQDTGAPTNGGYISPSVDSIQEMRVQTGNENAEFGGRAGGTINVVTKSGTNAFHGDVYEFNRNNFYNSNDYFRNQNSDPAISGHPAPYKFNNFGGTLGGPILLPFTQWNRNRNKAFFFVSSDNLHRTTSSNPSNQTMPTPAERAGVFTNLTKQFTDPAGIAPTCTGSTPNITCTFPAADMNTAGQKFLSLLPLPNCLRSGDTATGLNAPLAGLPNCPTDSFNFNYVNVTPHPWWNDTARLDFNISNNETFYIRLLKNYEQTQGQFGFLGGSGSWPQSLINYTIHSDGAVGTLVSTLRSNLVNEVTFGTNYALQTVDPYNKAALDNNNRALLGLGPTVLPVLFPDATNGGAQSKQVNEHDLIPNVSFGSFTNENASVGGNDAPGKGTLPNSPGFSFESRYPFFGTDSDWTITDNLSWVKGAHNFKFGAFYEHVSRTTATYSNRTGAQFNGVLNFSSSSTNPFDTGNTFANAYTGVYEQYAEDNARSDAHGLNYDIEWFAQDTWKVTRRLTLDYGMRFSILVPDYLRNGERIAQFTPSVYKLALQPGLIQPCLNTGGQRAGCESDGTFVSPSVIGLFDPTTYASNCSITGNAKCPYQGMVTFAGKAYNTPPVAIGPRFGFAWDVFGTGKTAVRGGFGMFYDRTGGIDDVLTQVDQPPLILGPSIYNGTIGQLLATPPSQLFIGPQRAYGNLRDFSSPQVYDFNLGVQHDLTHGVLLDISYVGNVSRHGRRTTDLTNLPYGEDFQSQYADPTQPGKPLPANIIRCMDAQLVCGYNSQPFATFDANSNYNSLQATVTKRFGRGLTTGAAYTYSKVLDEGGCCNLWLPDSYYYGPGSQDRRHNLTINWSYNIPNSHFENRFAKLATNGWTVQGVASFISGAPGTVSWSYNGDPNGATNGGNQGGPTTPSLVAGKSAYGSRASATKFLNAGAFQAAPNGPGSCVLNEPATCGLGNVSPRDVFTQPGVNNWDISLFKNIHYSSNEARYIQLRWETYNTFNHTQFNNLGGSSTNASSSSFGKVTSAKPPRIMALAVKVYF
ncbi:MAG: carboxypeptidase regulatory-like domain-containing protein [Candidatus Acidiferrales bacterium]